MKFQIKSFEQIPFVFKFECVTVLTVLCFFRNSISHPLFIWQGNNIHDNGAPSRSNRLENPVSLKTINKNIEAYENYENEYESYADNFEQQGYDPNHVQHPKSRIINQNFLYPNHHLKRLTKSSPPKKSFKDNLRSQQTSKNNNERKPEEEQQPTTRITRKIDKENVIEEDIKVDNTSLNMEFNTMVVCVVVLLIILVLIAIGCGIFMICKKDNPETGLGYSVAISNRLFKESTDGSDLPCLNCRLIEMGEMACYTERCPQCGNVPPCRKDMYPDPDRQRKSQTQQQIYQQRHQKQIQQQALQTTASPTMLTYSSASRDAQSSTSRSPRTGGGRNNVTSRRDDVEYYMGSQNANML